MIFFFCCPFPVLSKLQMLDLKSSSKSWTPKIWEHWKWHCQIRMPQSLILYCVWALTNFYIPYMYKQHWERGLTESTNLDDAFATFVWSRHVDVSRYSLQLPSPTMHFPPTPVIFSAQSRRHPFNEQLFNILFPPRCSVCGPKALLTACYLNPTLKADLLFPWGLIYIAHQSNIQSIEKYFSLYFF